MIIKRNHPKYVVKIDPSDKTIIGTKFGNVKFTEEEMHFDFTGMDDVKEHDVPMAFVRVLNVDKETVFKEWENERPLSS